MDLPFKRLKLFPVIQRCSLAKLLFLFQNGPHISETLLVRRRKRLRFGIMVIHSHFKFYANPVNGMAAGDFQTKNKLSVCIICLHERERNLFFSFVIWKPRRNSKRYLAWSTAWQWLTSHQTFKLGQEIKTLYQ